MTNHVSLLLESAAARKRLTHLFQSELGRGNRLSTAIVACGLSRAARTGTQQNRLVIFGYCLMARMLSLLPWNRTEPITADLVRRTFLSRPRPLDRGDSVSSARCEVGLCSIEAQVEPERVRDGTTPDGSLKHRVSGLHDFLRPTGAPKLVS
jgi:hypothetical protein